VGKSKVGRWKRKTITRNGPEVNGWSIQEHSGN
jgi:hypothetical protein